MNFLPIAILAYILNAGSTVFDKILLKKSIPNPLVYIFYINMLGGITLVLLPFGVKWELFPVILASLAGLLGSIALLCYFEALRRGEASTVAPIVGGLNPLFSLLVGSIFLGAVLSPTQLVAFFLLILGAVVLTYKLWSEKLQLNKQLMFMILSGFLFGLSYILLKASFDLSNFVTGLVISRIAGVILALIFLFFPLLRAQLFASNLKSNHFANKTSLILIVGQIMGASSGLLVTYAVMLANPALVNALFGVQYLFILTIAAFLAKEHHAKLLNEDLSRKVLVEKIIGAIILSIGVYLLSK